MKATIKATLAIVSVLLRRVALVIASIILVSGALVSGVGFYLASTGSSLWLILAIPPIVLCVIVIVLLIIALVIAHMLLPRQLSRVERRQIATFIDHLGEAAEAAQISRLTLAYQLIHDAIRKISIQERVRRIGSGARNLEREFEAIREMF